MYFLFFLVLWQNMSQVNSRLVILVAPWLPTVLNMLKDIPLHNPTIENLVRDILLCQLLLALLSLPLTFWLLRDTWCSHKNSFPQ